MSTIAINGPAKLKGVVRVQGAKNSAMKHIFIPLIGSGRFIIENIPQIGSIENHIDLIKFLGAKTNRLSKNKIEIYSNNDLKIKPVPKEFIYYTSGGNHIIPIIASKYGCCKVDVNPQRKDYGGDQIGLRKLTHVIKTLKYCGIDCKKENEMTLVFSLTSTEPFKYKVPNKSFGGTINSLFSALFKEGKSTISNYTTTPEFFDIYNFLVKTGAKIKISPDKIEVYGPAKINETNYKNMNDPHDFVTWLFAGLSTNSAMEIEGIEYEKMKLDVLERSLKKMNVNVDLHSYKTILTPQLSKIRPMRIFAGQYPKFTTEWQVLISPLLTQIEGSSKVIETLFTNRMQHWSEMAKMGVKFEYFQDSKYPEVERKPRAVSVTGPQKLHSATVNARDVRTGACLLISSLVANGKTTIQNAEHIDRGYENIGGRLKNLGVNIEELL